MIAILTRLPLAWAILTTGRILRAHFWFLQTPFIDVSTSCVLWRRFAVITVLNVQVTYCVPVVVCKACCLCVTSTEQLVEIRKVTLAKLICINSDNISKIQPNIMQLPFRQVYHSSLYVSYVTVTHAVFSHNSLATCDTHQVCRWTGCKAHVDVLVVAELCNCSIGSVLVDISERWMHVQAISHQPSERGLAVAD